MTSIDFTKLVTFWSLKGQISHKETLGTKGLGENKQQVKRIIIKNPKVDVSVTYTECNEAYEISYCDVTYDNGVSSLFTKEACLRYLEEI